MKRRKDNFFLISEKTKRQLIDEQFKLSKIAFVLECSTILEFILLFKFFLVLCLLFVLFVAFPCVHYREHLVLAFFYFFSLF